MKNYSELLHENEDLQKENEKLQAKNKKITSALWSAKCSCDYMGEGDWMECSRCLALGIERG